MYTIVNRLCELENQLRQQEQLQNELELLQNQLYDEKSRPNYKLRNFDLLHKEKFIKDKCGEAPVEPKKKLAIVVPVYLRKKKEYELALENFNEDILKAEKEYFVVFEKDRTLLIEEDNQEREVAILRYLETIEKIKEKLLQSKLIIDGEDIIGKPNKNILDVQKLIEIFETKRAETIKEAMNVLIEDRHREKIEELQAEQLELVKEAQEAAERASECADEATNIAKRALDRIEEVYYKANEAYYKAEEAYQKAESAYSEAMRVSNN